MTLLSVQTTAKRATEGVGRVATSVLEWSLYTMFALALIAAIGLGLGAVGDALNLGLSNVDYAVSGVVVFILLALYDRFA